MIRYALGLIMLLIARPAVGIAPSPVAVAPRGQDEVAVLLDRWVAMWNSYDLDQLDRLFRTDDRVSYFSSEYDGLIRGRAALRAHHERFGFVPGGKQTGNRLWLESIVIERFGEAASVTATWLFRRAGAEATQRGPVSFVIVTDGAGPRIAHAHFANRSAN